MSAKSLNCLVIFSLWFLYSILVVFYFEESLIKTNITLAFSNSPLKLKPSKYEVTTYKVLSPS